jgi:hypothetical protein
MSVENEEEEDRKATTKDGVVGKKSPEYKKIYYLRHKLQRFVYNKKEVSIVISWLFYFYFCVRVKITKKKTTTINGFL